MVAENYLKKSGIDFTIVRPGGLKAKPPTGALQISGEDTLNSGEISRDLVADVCVASLTDSKASNKVLGEFLIFVPASVMFRFRFSAMVSDSHNSVFVFPLFPFEK